MEMDSLVPHHAAATWSLPASQTLAKREELLLVQHAMEGFFIDEASATRHPPPLPSIHLLPTYMIQSNRQPPWTMTTTRASTTTTMPSTWSNSATTSSTV